MKGNRREIGFEAREVVGRLRHAERHRIKVELSVEEVVKLVRYLNNSWTPWTGDLG